MGVSATNRQAREQDDKDLRAHPASAIQTTAAWSPPPGLGRTLRPILALDDFEPAARRRLPRPIFGFVQGGAETNSARDSSRAAFADYDLIPRVLVDTAVRSQRTQLFGRSYAAPFGIAPMGASMLAAYDADLVLARAAAEAEIPFILSASSLTPLERVRQVGRTAWYQGYLPGDLARIEPLVERVGAAGFDTFVLTVDVPVTANRENNVRAGFSIPLRPSIGLAWQGITHPVWLLGTALRTLATLGLPYIENMDAERGPPILSRAFVRAQGPRERLAWPHLEAIRRRWAGRLVVKGVLAGEDAHIAAESGVDAVMVSNHGGRQLDHAIAPLRALPGVVARRGDMTVILDGGLRRGTDVLKALALGADFVFVARPFLFAAAVAGAAGVQHAIRLLSTEIDRDMALLGISALRELGPAYLRMGPRAVAA
jgi:L-lactate dehydrogenase (cytochrome)